MRPVDRELADFVRTRRGVFTRAEARRIGFSDKSMWLRISGGAWRQLERDVFALASAPTTWPQRAYAATCIHPAGALSHQAAAAWLALDGFRHGRIHVAVPPCGHHRSHLADVHRTRHHEFTVVDGIRTTTFAQTVIQLAGVAPIERLRSAVHSGVHQDRRRLRILQDRVRALRARRLPGMGRLVELLDEVDGHPPTQSELERMLFDVLDEVVGLPEVVRQHPMPWRSDRSTLVDGFVPEWRLVLEADGRRWHTRVEDFETDRWRDAEAAAHGLHVMRFTWERLRHDRAGVIDQVQRFAASRSRRAA